VSFYIKVKNYASPFNLCIIIKTTNAGGSMDSSKTVIIAVAAAFIVGLLLGYNLKGGKEGKKEGDQQLVQQTRKGMEQLAKENKDLHADLKRLKEDTSKRENEDLKEQLKKARHDKEISVNEINSLRVQVAKAESRLQSEAELKAVIEKMKVRIGELEKETHDLNQVIDRINSLTEIKHKGVPEHSQ
jgi:predicted RNase H-like nuclease (RuvC/YqgF family)